MPSTRPPRSARPARAALVLALAVLAVAALASCAPAPATMSATPPAAEARGAGPSVDTFAAGTVKIHDGNSESEGPANNPKVCTFHIHFFLGSGSSGAWRIATQPGGTEVLSGVWSSGSADSVRVPPHPTTFSLPDGQYKLFWSQAGQPGGDKQKVFKVDCASSPGTPTQAPGPSASGGPTASPTASSSTPPPTAAPTDAPVASPTATVPAPTDPPTAAPEVTPGASPDASALPTAVPTPTPTPTPSPPASGQPGGSADPGATTPPASPGPTPGGSVAGERTAAPSGGAEPDTSTAADAPGRPGGPSRIAWLGLAALAGAAIALRRPARRS